MAVNPPGGPGQGVPAGAQPAGGFTQGSVRAGSPGGGGGGGLDVGGVPVAKPGKPFGGFLSSEFVVFLLTAIAVAIAGLAADDMEPNIVWTLITILAFAFIVSRGLAKREDRGRDGGRF